MSLDTPERSFGRYELLLELAQGGMATLYLARLQGPKQFEKLLVLKRIHAHLAREANFIRMFSDEARIAARINHANVANVFDMGEVNGTHFLVQEYVHGQNLREVQQTLVEQSRWLSGPLAAYLLAETAAGLHAAHELTDSDGHSRGVVHRDVSPHNILVSYDGQVKVIDFGVAFATERLSQTSTGTLKGKAAYMSPEQVNAQPVDRRSDIFSLGVVLFEVLTGQRLFKAESEAATIKLVDQADIPRPRDLNPELSAGLEEVALKALARDPAHRYPTAGAMEQALRHAGAGVGAGTGADPGQPVGRQELAVFVKKLFQDLKVVKDEQIRAATRPSAARPVPTKQTDRSTPSAGITAVQISSAKAAPWGGRRLPWLVAGVGLLIAFAVFLLLSSDRATTPPREPTSPSTASLPVRGDGGQPAPTEAPLPGPQMRRSTGPASVTGKVRLKLTILPEDAEAVVIFRGVHTWGNAYHAELVRSATPVKLQIKARGYRAVTLSRTPDRSLNEVVRLKPAKPARRGRPTRRPPARPGPRATPEDPSNLVKDIR